VSEFTEHPERIVLALESGPRDRRAAITASTSLVLHIVVIGLMYLAQLQLERKPDKDEPSLPLIFEELTQPKAPQKQARVPLDLSQPPPPPRPPPDQDAPRDGQLFGFNSQGERKGEMVRPPGPETGRFGPEEPGEKGKGMQDGGAAEDAAKKIEPPRSSDPEDNPEPVPPPETPRGEGLGGDPLPRPPGDDLPRPRRPAPTPGARPPAYRGPGTTADGGRRGARGSGMDFNVGAGGGAFGDLQFESSDYNWSDYSSKVYWAVYRAWLRELYGRTARFERDQVMRRLDNLDGEVTIRVTLHRRAAIDTEILVPSVVPTLDEASEAALHRAVLPDLPSDFPRNSERVTWRFRIEGFESAQQLQRNLDVAQMRGVF
jgi:hypothetical protein